MDSRIHPIHVLKNSAGFSIDVALPICLRKTGCAAVQEVVNCLKHLVSGLLFGTPIVNFLLFSLEDSEQVDRHLLNLRIAASDQSS